MAKVLVVDDDKSLCELVVDALEFEGHAVEVSNDGEDALTRLKLVVRRGLFGRDPATASELIEQAARALDEIRPAGAAFPRVP